ncbi:hypothetical protein AAE478_008851 [Parahypoxylon ruwenzoriense]
MSLPTTNASGQSSIRNFFQPKPPSQNGQNGQNDQNGQSTLPLPPAPASTPPSRPPSLHPQATISPILPEYIPALRRITSLLLPVNYGDSFYARLSDPLSSGAFSRVLLWNDDPDPDPNAPPSASALKVIGGLVCRPEPSPFNPASGASAQQSIFSMGQPTTPDAQPNALYIQSLVLLSPYRHLGLAAALLDEVVGLAACSPFACETVYAHVWTDNEDGLRWYLARGFTKTEEIKGYYFKLKPDSAWVVRQEIRSGNRVSAALGLGASNGVPATATVIPPSTTAAAANLAQTSTPPAPAPAATSAQTLSPPPPRSSGPSPNRSPGLGGMSYQNTRPETEWNDLPVDMHTATSSNASSRSSSTARKKRDRAYPAAAFGK